MGEELKGLLEKRRVCRGRFSKFTQVTKTCVEEAEQLIRQGDAPEKDVRLAVRRAMTALKPVEDAHSELSEIQEKIDFHPDNEERLEGITDDDGEVKYLKAFTSINAAVQELERVLSPTPPEKQESETSAGEGFTPEAFAECFTKAIGSINTGVTEDQLTQILSTLTQKKRVVEIPKFKGDLELFDQWRDLVDAEVKKPGYSEVEKTHVALTLLDGEVAKLVSALKDPSYDDIMEFLENRYGDVLARIEKAVNEIASVPVVKSPTVQEMDPCYNKLVANWNYIKKRTKDDKELLHSSWLLTALVRQKMPKSLVRKWDAERLKDEKKSTSSSSNLPIGFDDLLEKIQDAVKVARRSESTPNVPAGKDRKVERPFTKPRPSGHALSVTKKTQRSNEEPRCIFCNGNHQSYSCPSVSEMSVDQRCDKVRTVKACFNCLSRTHMVRTCKSRGCKVCGRHHHTLLHFERKRESQEQQSPKSNENNSPSDKEKTPNEQKVESVVGLVKSSGASKVLMQTAVVNLESKHAVSRGRVLFDSGSGVTFISTKMAKQLNLKGPKVHGEFALAGGGQMTLKTERVKFIISSALPKWKGETFEVEAYVIEKPSAELSPVEIDVSQLPHLQGLQLADTYPRGKKEIDVMLGIEDTINILMDKRIRGQSGWPVAQRSHVGWVLSGPCPESPTQSDEQIVINSVSFEIKDETAIATKHWETEHIGIQPQEKKIPTELELSAMKQHEEKTRQIENRYETGLIRHPRYIDERLKSNKSQAMRRLLGLERRLQRDSNLAELYRAQINDLLSTGRAEKVQEKEEPGDRQVWYLPHHPVVKPDRATTKVRVVFDGSMVGQEGISLNDTLLPGPALQPDLPGVLMRFRRHKVAIVADIEKMFLQVQVREEDRDMQRFLWRDLDTSKEPQVYRLKTVTFGLTSSPFSSIQTVKDHVRKYQEEYPKAVREIEDNTFVDDVLTGDDSIDDAAALTVDLKTIKRDGGWPLKKFRSNKSKALSLLDETDLATQSTKMVVGEETSTKTLGVKYEPTEDVLMFSFCERMDENGEETKRTILRQLHRVYDPLGMVSPFTVVAKQLFQMSWMTGLGWDERVPEDLEQKWMKWKSEVPGLDEIKVQRCLIPEEFSSPSFTLHGFGDASEAAYGGAVYLRVEDTSQSRVHTALLCSKTRVAPVGKRRTIPELELMASLTVARLITYVEKELKLPIQSKTCWTDSQVVLHWIRQPSYHWQTFIANRVSEIQGLVQPSDWRHIPGKQNPADLCSRGMSANELVESSLWWNGPEFLRSAETDWPEQPVIDCESKEEAKKKEKHQKIAAVFNVTPGKPEPDPQQEYVERFSSFGKFIRVMTLVRSWLMKFRRKKSDQRDTQSEDEGSDKDGDVISERKQEELRWIRWVQEKHFKEEVDILQAGESVTKQSKLAQLNPYWDNKMKVMRVGGRLNYAALPEETKHPIILPTHNPFVEKLVMHYHVLQLHTGPAQTLASLRNSYWIVHGRQEIRRVLRACKTCREPLKLYQQMAPLPEERTCVIPAFVNVGVDFAGPLFVKVLTSGAAGERKIYICLFSCMVSRAIHLELVETLSTEQFLLALKRMMSRRGRCRLIISDNAKTFKKASDIIKRLFNNPKALREGLEKEGIRWKFITERAPWHGGFYERMVGSVKRVLKRVLGKSRLTQIEMETTLAEIEAQINSRPLTAVSSDSEDLAPLTPGHLAIGRSPQSLPDVDRETEKMTLGKRWKYQQTLLKQFWNRWSKEYLLQLQQMRKWVDVRDNAKVGDVVLVAEDNQRKQDWMLGRINELHPGRDGLVRSVTVKTARGMRRRPVQRLRLLEPADVD